MIWAALAFSLVLQTGSSARPEPGFIIHPRACEDDYVFIEAVTGRLKTAQEGKIQTTQIDSLHDDLIFTVEPKSLEGATAPDWKSIKLSRDGESWKYEVTFKDDVVLSVPAKSVRVQSNFNSFWNLLASSKVDGQGGALLQKCELGNCRTEDGKEKFSPLNSSQVPKPGADVQYRLSIQGKDDKQARVQFDLDQSYLGLRKSWSAQNKASSRTTRLPYFTSNKICVLVEKSGACEEDKKENHTKDSSIPVVIERKELKTDSEEFKRAESTFNTFTSDLHLDVTEVLRTARAKKPIIIKPSGSTSPK